MTRSFKKSDKKPVTPEEAGGAGPDAGDAAADVLPEAEQAGTPPAAAAAAEEEEDRDEALSADELARIAATGSAMRQPFWPFPPRPVSVTTISPARPGVRPAVAPGAAAAGFAAPPVAPPPAGRAPGVGAVQQPAPAGTPPVGPAVGPAPETATRPVAGPARIRRRHRGILASFVGLVLLPILATASYLWLVAVDEYASTVGFSVRTEEMTSSLDILGGITRLSSGSSSDADILYDYIHSQELVEHLDREIDLRRIFSIAWPQDPIFAFDPSGTIEDLVDHWEHKVKIVYDTSSGLMTLRVLAFSREEATEIATRILERSTEKVNELSQDAREDATRYARAEMERALDRLKAAREALTRFRMQSRVVDPVADLQGQMGVLNSLQAQLAESYVELDLLRATANGSDPRITQTEQRITVIQKRIAEERRKFGEDGQGPGGEDYATMVAEFERLSVDQQFAEQTYHAALAAYDAAQADAQRKSRYLAVHIQPTRAEKAEYPARWTLLGLTSFFLLMAWSIGVLVFYSIRDRR